MEIQNVCSLRNILKKSYGQAYVPVKSKPQHPPGAFPGHLMHGGLPGGDVEASI